MDLLKSHIALLIVDDDEMASDILARRLRREDYQVDVVTNGKAALERMTVENFDLVLLDYMMPEIAGDEVLRNIRRSAKMKDTSIIMLTAGNDKQSFQACMEAGADDYLLKPVNFPLLKTRIWQLLRMQKLAHRSASEDNAGLDGARVLIVDNEELNREVLERRLSRYGCHTESVIDGKKALEKLSASEYDLVLLDIHMPQMNGIDVLRLIRREERLKHLPVVMITARDEDAVQHECLIAGASDYITKPFNSIALRTRLQVCLKAFRLESAG